MCFGTVRHSCSHGQKIRLNCRKTWRQRTGSFCYPIVTFMLGSGPNEPCDEVRDDKYWWSTSPCPDCRAADQAGAQTKGMVYEDRYREKLEDQGLRDSRRRKQEEDRQKLWEKGLSREEKIRLEQMKRDQRERAANDSNNNKTQTALPAMPNLVHVPLGDQWGQPRYHYPPQVANQLAAATSPRKATRPLIQEQPHESYIRGQAAGATVNAAGEKPPVGSRYGVTEADHVRPPSDGINPYRPYDQQIKEMWEREAREKEKREQECRERELRDQKRRKKEQKKKQRGEERFKEQELAGKAPKGQIVNDPSIYRHRYPERYDVPEDDPFHPDAYKKYLPKDFAPPRSAFSK